MTIAAASTDPATTAKVASGSDWIPLSFMRLRATSFVASRNSMRKVSGSSGPGDLRWLVSDLRSSWRFRSIDFISLLAKLARRPVNM